MRLDGRAVQNAISSLGREARDWLGRASSPHERDMGRALGQVRDAVERIAIRHSPTDAMEGFRAVNRAHQGQLRLERAAGSVAAEDGIFSPAQLHNATKVVGGERAFARGRAPGQELSSAAKATMSQRVGDSGTAGRMLQYALLGGGGSAVAALGGPALAAKLAALGIPYSPGGAQVTRALMSGVGRGPRRGMTRRALRRVLERGAQYTAPGAGVAGYPLLPDDGLERWRRD